MSEGRRFPAELSKRSWCPHCGIERTGDEGTRPCACMAREVKRAVRGVVKRGAPRLRVVPSGDLFAQIDWSAT